MRLFALKDSADAQGSTLAVVSCYGAGREYHIDMPKGTDPWTVPLILSSFASRGAWTVDPAWSRRWAESRVAPRSRQNLGEVLKVNGLDRYDSLKLLELTGGRNSQDSCYLEPLAPADAPEWFRERERGRIVEAVPLERFRLLVAFREGDACLCDVRAIGTGDARIARALVSRDAFWRVQVALGGRGVRWGENAWIADSTLREAGVPVPLSWEDLAAAAPGMLVDATEAARMLGCTRQNVNALVKSGALRPAKTTGKATLFLRADIAARQA
ncbi:MAG: helix-turn-helix domain-containing protein [Eggerthellaceae bacterium]|nr:helix-turn-helix domain-containing protein [Eggerthellaceae bacterium]